MCGWIKRQTPPPPSTHRHLVEVLLWFGFALLCNVASRSEVKGNVREEISKHTRTNAGPQSESIKTQSSEKRFLFLCGGFPRLSSQT